MTTSKTKTAKTKMEKVPVPCPACSHGKAYRAKEYYPGLTTGFSIYVCAQCEALHGTCYLGDSYALVLPYFHKGPEKPEDTRYFDFECLGSKGITRRHGWYHVGTRRITQVG